MVVVAAVDDDGFASSAVHVAAFTTPSAGVMPLAVWNAMTWAFVPEPKVPSAVPTL